MTAQQVRDVLLSLPEVVERDHHGRPSFRVGGQIIATLWSPHELNVMAGEERIAAAVAGHPEICSDVRWGGRVAAVRVALDRVDAELLEDLLDHAWRRAAPANLRRAALEAEAFATLGLGDDDLQAWRSSGRSTDELDAWLTDRVARRPSGGRAADVYGSDDVHEDQRRRTLEALALGAGDHLLEVGCGGGLLLRDAAATGATVTGLDHSEDMVSLARARAPKARIVLGVADHLPFADEEFTAAAMVMVFMLLADPAPVLQECRRVLGPDGRLVIYTPGPELRGTPALPEPIAGYSHVYEDEELAALVRHAGFERVSVDRDDGAQLVVASVA